MAQNGSQTATLNRFTHRRWPRLILPTVIVLVVLGFYAAMLAFQDWQANHHYRLVEAEADRLDPGWRLDDLLASRAKLPDSANSAVFLESLAGQLPTDWPGDLLYDWSFYDLQRPDSAIASAKLREVEAVFESISKFVPQARKLAEMLQGNYAGRRPSVERLELVGSLNAFRDVHFLYGEDVRRVILILWLDAIISLEKGDQASAMVDVKAMLNASRSIGDYPGLSAQQLRMGSHQITLSLLERILAHGEVGDSLLAEVESILIDEEKQPSAMIALKGERAIVDDLLNQIREGRADLGAIPSFYDYPWIDRAFDNRANLRQNQGDLLRFHLRSVEIGKLPEGDQIAAMKSLIAEWSKASADCKTLERPGKLPERLLLGRSAGIPLWFGADRAKLRVAIAALAAERYRLVRGHWPDSIDVLVPDWLKAIPTDPFGRGPIKRIRLTDGLLFYSVGFDGRDDGGKIIPGLRMDGLDVGFRLWDTGGRHQPVQPKPRQDGP